MVITQSIQKEITHSTVVISLIRIFTAFYMHIHTCFILRPYSPYDALSKGMDEMISHVVSGDTENKICMPKTSLWVTINVFIVFSPDPTPIIALPCYSVTHSSF